MSFDRTLHALIIARHNIDLIKQWAGEREYNNLSADVMCCYALQYAFINIAEAVKDIPESTLERYSPSSYWRDIIGFRNHLVHTYDDQLDHRIMDTIHNDLPELNRILEKMLRDFESEKS